MVGYVIGGALAVIAAVFAVLLIVQQKRIRQLAEQMEDFLTGSGKPLSYSLKEDAVAPLENAAAEMENRIEVEKERYRQEARRTSDLTADISHQLKTPLASLRLFVEMDESSHLAQEISQIERMEMLISSLLRLEKLCSDSYAFTFAEHSVRPVIEQVWCQLHPLWPDKSITITGDAAIRCDEKWLAEAFQNLLKNACEHTAADGKITVSLEQTAQAFYCTIADNGGGVSENDLPHLFERFYRAEGQKQSGAGLGLAIVKEIVFRHHGHITAENTKDGLKFSISIPVLNLTKS